MEPTDFRYALCPPGITQLAIPTYGTRAAKDGRTIFKIVPPEGWDIPASVEVYTLEEVGVVIEKEPDMWNQEIAG